jgi:hypothetical protein
MVFLHLFWTRLTLSYRWLLLNRIDGSEMTNGSPSGSGVAAWLGPSLVF